jgi:hypothetical protein
VDPALLAAEAPRALAEVRLVGLVRAHLLRRHDDAELGPQVAARDAQELVVDVGDDADVVAAAEAVHGRVGLAKRLPASDRVRHELCPGGLQLPADLLGDLYGRPAQDLGVELVGAAHDLGLHLEEALDERPLVERESVALRLLAKRVGEPLLPIDQGPVAVSGNPLDVLEMRERHARAGEYR